MKHKVKVTEIFNILILTVITFLSACKATKSVENSAVHDNLIIYYEPAAGNSDLIDAAKRYGSRVLYVYKNINGIAVTVPSGRTVTDAIRYYENIKGVLSVTQDQEMQLD